jgi:glycine oxidase
MNRDLRIVGHGLAGCVLAMTCYRQQIPFSIIGSSHAGEASMASSGLIAPVTGRRYVKAWMIGEFISGALDFYRWTEEVIGGKFFFPVEIVRFLSNPEAQNAWNKRLDDPEYAAFISRHTYEALDQINRPYGILTGGYRLDTPGWIKAVREFLSRHELLKTTQELFEGPSGSDETLIYATGAVDPSLATGIIPNKGEALIVRMPDWTMPVIIKEEVFIVPLKEKDFFWVGSYYQPWPDNPFPSKEGKEQLLQSIRKIYRGELEIASHLSGVRPTVDDRRPLIGSRPGHPGQYIFNGMGTKGTSLAPFWAVQLLSHIREGMPLPEEVKPARYYI